MDLVQRMCDHVAVIAAGRVLAAGTVDQVRGAQSLWEHRKGHSRHYAADITWHLQPQADGWRISQKVIRLVNSDDVLHSIGYIL